MRYTIEQFMQTTKVLGGVFSPDQRSLRVFTSNATGVFNVYSISLRGGQPHQLTHSSTHNVYGISYFPDGERILIRVRKGETRFITYVFWIRVASVLDLTPSVTTLRLDVLVEMPTAPHFITRRMNVIHGTLTFIRLTSQH